MEIKRKYLLISLTSILCGMLLFFYACMEEEKETDERNEFSSELEFGKNKELTKSIAKEWYQTSQKPVTRMVRDEGDDLGGVLVMPSWNHAKEWKKGKYEVVESSLKTQKGIIFVDNETREKIDSESADLTKIKNIGRMVFLKDMETGEIINFNMVVIASYKYLMKEDNQLSKNTYLEREANFDGTILFYHPDGRFVNGWRYDNGKITHRLSPLEKNNPLTKAWVERCYEDCYSYSENICENTTETDAEFGQMPVVECRTEWYDNCYNTCQMEWEDDPHKPGDVEGGYEPGGGSSGGSATPNLNKVSKKNSLNNNDKKKLEEKIEEMRDDCGYQELFNYAEQNGFKINDIKIDPSYKYSGYNPVTNEIVFKSSSEIDNNSFDEEFVHFIQNNMYPGGTSQYVDKGKINLEFEAKIIQDIICGTTSPHVSSGCQYLGGKGEFVSQYAMWIDGIIRTGKFPNYNQIQLEYWTYIEGLKVVPQYNTEVDESIQPLVLNFLNNNACK